MSPILPKRLACLRFVAAAVVLAIAPGQPALAQDAFNPFESAAGAPPPSKPAQPPPTDPRPPLAPMDGSPPDARYAPPVGHQSGDLGIDSDGPPQGGIGEIG